MFSPQVSNALKHSKAINFEPPLRKCFADFLAGGLLLCYHPLFV